MSFLQLAERDLRIAEFEKLLAERDEQIAELEMLAERIVRIADHEKTSAERKTRGSAHHEKDIAELNVKVAERDI